MINYCYSEIHQSADYHVQPDFPKSCPICGAPSKPNTKPTYYNGPVYECDGQYTDKAQCQNHTDVWWGICPAKKEEARLNDGRECGGCKEKRLEGIGYWSDSHGWTCRNCNHNNPVNKVAVS